MRTVATNDRYESETARWHRETLAPFCVGNGLDIGYGGDPIVPEAITLDVDRADRANCGDHPMNIAGDARNLVWFRDGVLDYVYAGHTLEDFEDTLTVLREWTRVLKAGGVVVLALPDQRKYVAHCTREGTVPNPGHKIPQFGMQYMRSVIARHGGLEIVHTREVGPYGFEIVARKK